MKLKFILRKSNLFVVFFSVFTCCSSTIIFAQQNYSITINDVPKQKLLLIGSSAVPLHDNVPTWATEAMADSIYKSLAFKALRLWCYSEYESLDDMMTRFDNWYIKSGIIDAAKKRGVEVLLLAPSVGEETPAVPMEQYTRKLADFIKKLKDERGIIINVTGVANEPGFTVDQMTNAVKLFRQALDIRGLNNVSIVAPESSSADAKGASYITGIKNDPTAWNALRGIASHSYNMAANKEFENSVKGTGKEYWMTEASDNGNEGPNDDTRAATTAARFLNDMNHYVDNWFFFIGYKSSDDVTTDNDNATKLIVYDFKTGKLFPHLKYFYFKQIRSVFDYNAVFRDAISATEGDMVYTYGQKPAINCAAAKNPDGSWAIGAVNLTGINATWFGESYYPAATYNITIHVKELANIPETNFRLYRSSATKRFFNDGIVTMKYGSVTVTITPKEFISLRSTSSSSSKAGQTINFAPLSNKTYGDAPFTINASSSSGLPVSLSVISGPAAISGNTVTLTGTGTVEISANQPGNETYNEAPTVKQSFSVITNETPAQCSATGSILYEQWTNVGGNNIWDNNFSNIVNNTKAIYSFEGPTDALDNYASRIRGYVCPPQTGYYTFWIAGDDATELYVSKDDNPSNKVKIAYNLSWTGSREWNKYPTQKSAQVYLEAGKKYYIEAVHKEGGGGDNLAVAWQLPSGGMEAPIPGNRLSPFQFSSPVAADQTINFIPVNNVVVGVAPFALSATASSGLPVSFKVISGPASITGNICTVNATGLVTIEASQSGNTSYNPAPVVSRTFMVSAPAAVDQTITFAPIASVNVGAAPFTLFATASSGLLVSFKIVSGPASVQGNTCTVTGSGTVVIEASQQGNNAFNAAPAVSQSFEVITIPVPVPVPVPQPNACAATGTILREQWNNVGGNNLWENNWNKKPEGISLLTLFEGPVNSDDNYASRIRGYICPPASGNYVFWIAGDDATELYLSTDASPSNKTKIAYNSSWTGSREWNKFSTQKSAHINLTAGKKYYIEAIHKEGGGGDNLAVAWQLPDGTFEGPIAGSHLSPFEIETVAANQTINFQNIADVTFGDAPFSLHASATSGLPVSFRIISGLATVVGNIVTPTGFGTVTVEASQGGNASYKAADAMLRTFNILPVNQCAATGYILREYWNYVNGNNLSDNNWNKKPDGSSLINLFEGPSNYNDNYASRLRGFICPPQDGFFTFWIAGDDAAELYLSTDASPSGKVKIAYNLNWTGYREWDRFPTQKSAPVYMQAGKKYYIEAIHKEGNGGDNLAVGWELPNGKREMPIPGNHLSPYENGLDQITEATSDEKESSIDIIDDKKFSAVEVFPNPAVNFATVIFKSVEEGTIKVELNDLHGRNIMHLFNGMVERGSLKTIRFNTTSIVSGVYLIRIITGKKAESRKIIIVR